LIERIDWKIEFVLLIFYFFIFSLLFFLELIKKLIEKWITKFVLETLIWKFWSQKSQTYDL